MIRNSFRFLASLTRMCCRMCCRVGYEGNSLKTSVILRTEHVKRKTVAWRMINYELPYSSNSVLFAFNNFPVQKNRTTKACEKGNYPCGNEEKFPCGNDCKSSRRIHENSLFGNCWKVPHTNCCQKDWKWVHGCFEKNIARVTFALRLKVYLV